MSRWTLHSGAFPAFEGERPAAVAFRDRGVWLTHLYLGDALGFSIAYYSDVENYNVLANLAKHR